MAAVDERMPDGTQRMALADAGQAKGEHVGRVGEEVALRELVELAHQRRRQAALIEGRKRLARRKLDRKSTRLNSSH